MSHANYAEFIKNIWQGETDINQLLNYAEELHQNPELAATLYQTWLARHPAAPHAFVACFNLGVILSSSGDVVGANAAYERALQLRPHFLQARFNLGVLLENQGELDAALAQLGFIREQANVDDGDERNALIMALNRIGDLHIRLEQHDLAAQAFLDSIAIQPNQVAIIQQLKTLRDNQRQAPTPVDTPLYHHAISNNLHIIPHAAAVFPNIPSSVRFAILLPTARWGSMVKSIIGSFVGVANEEVALLISDNSENNEKRQFLSEITKINPYIITAIQERNIGGANNFYYLHDWSQQIEFTAQMADDDWVSPTYYLDAYAALLKTPTANCISAGTAFADFGDGQLHDISQPSMCGASPLLRMTQWNGIAARITMYDASRKSSINPAINFMRITPFHGSTLAEDLHELSRLATGDFLRIPGPGCFVHYPHHGSHTGDSAQRFYKLLCEDVGLQFHMVYFMGLSTAVQCAMFLLGRLSPITDPQHRMICAQYVFRHIFLSGFLPKIGDREGFSAAAASIFAHHPAALAGLERYCNPDNLEELVFDIDLLNWFIEIIRVFESPPKDGEQHLSEKFKQFCIDILGTAQ